MRVDSEFVSKDYGALKSFCIHHQQGDKHFCLKVNENDGAKRIVESAVALLPEFPAVPYDSNESNPSIFTFTVEFLNEEDDDMPEEEDIEVDTTAVHCLASVLSEQGIPWLKRSLQGWSEEEIWAAEMANNAAA
jgi:hypothetical protein